MTTRTADTDSTRFTIQEASRRTGVAESTLRYYERIGLLERVERDATSGHRRYDTATVEKIESLACLRSAGMRVDDMRRYLRLLREGPEAAAEQHELFHSHAVRLAAEIDALQLRLVYLRHKAEMWDARDRGDLDAELQATRDVIETAEQISAENRPPQPRADARERRHE